MKTDDKLLIGVVLLIASGILAGTLIALYPSSNTVMDNTCESCCQELRDDVKVLKRDNVIIKGNQDRCQWMERGIRE